MTAQTRQETKRAGKFERFIRDMLSRRESNREDDCNALVSLHVVLIERSFYSACNDGDIHGNRLKSVKYDIEELKKRGTRGTYLSALIQLTGVPSS